MAVLILVKESEFGFQLSSAGTLAKQVLKTPNRKSKREQMLVAFGCGRWPHLREAVSAGIFFLLK